MKFEIRFKHKIAEYYTCIVEADSEEKALEMFDEDPFDCGEIAGEPYKVNGLSVDVIEIKEIKSKEQ
jgi:hypothetical protein